MKKVFIFFVSFFLLFSIIFEVNAKVTNPKIIELNMNIYKKKLEKAKSGEKYLEIVNKKLGEKSEEELKSISEKVYNYLKTYKGENFNLLKYIQYRSDFLLEKGVFGKKIEEKSFDEKEFKIYKNDELGFEILQEKDLNIYIEGIGVGFFNEKTKKLHFVVALSDYSELKIKNTSDYIDDLSKLGAKKLNINGLKGYNFSYEGEKYLLTNYNEYNIFFNEEKLILYSIIFYDKDYKYKDKIVNSFKIIKNVDKDLINKKQKEFENKILKESIDFKRKSDLIFIHQFLKDDYAKNKFLPDSLEILQKIKDPKHGQVINGCKFGYNYEKISDKKYRLSSCMESVSGKEDAKNDGGIYDDKYEIIGL